MNETEDIKNNNDNSPNQTNIDSKQLNKNQQESGLEKILDKIVNEVKEYFSKYVLGGIIAFIFTGFAFFLTPLKEYVFHTIYPEKAKLVLDISHRAAVKGENISLSAHIHPDSKIPISEGVLRFIYDVNSFQVEGGEESYNTPKINNPIIYPEKSNQQLYLKCLSVGNHKIISTLETNFNLYSDTLEIEVLSTKGKPTEGNLSGEWNIRLGASRGKMVIQQVRKDDIIGTYEISNIGFIKVGDVSGFKDGVTFDVDFIEIKSKDPKEMPNTKWVIESQYSKNDFNYIEIEGTAQLMYFDSSGKWINEGAKEPFYATSSTN